MTLYLATVPGWRVTAVADGPQALEMLNAVTPHLVVLDHQMPGLTGLDVYALLQQRDAMATVPVLFVSAAQRPGTELPPDVRWLAKPFDIATLVATVADLLGEDVPEDVSP